MSSPLRRFGILLTACLLAVTALTATAGAEETTRTTLVGRAQVSDAWVRVAFDRPVLDPVVVVGPVTGADAEPLSTRVRDVTPDGFEVRLEEWAYLDGTHPVETVAWMVASRGTTTLPSGAVVEAGTTTVTTSFAAVTFPAPLAGSPVVTATPVDGTDLRAAAPRLRAVGTTGFELRVDGQEVDRPGADGGHAAQPVNWLAFHTPTSTGDDPDFSWQRVDVVAGANTATAPLVGPVRRGCLLGGAQTTNGNDTATVRSRGFVPATGGGAGGVDVFVEEERSADTEVGHAGEAVALLVVECAATHVVHVSLDGVRPDVVQDMGATLLPNLFRLADEGTSTMNARSDADITKTLPNHTSQLTGRPVAGPDGHGVTVNQDAPGQTIHGFAGEYVASVFDVVHDRGLRTGLFAGKDKFDTIERSYTATTGAPDVTGADDGRDKIDVYLRTSTAALVQAWADEMTGPQPLTYSLLHLRDTDIVGHDHGWADPEYRDALVGLDTLVGQVVATVAATPHLAGRTVVIVTSDHGGVGHGHADGAEALNYTIPFWAWGQGVDPGTDLYVLNDGHFQDPGTGRPAHDAAPPPIRGHVVANLGLGLLGLPPIPGSVENATQGFEIGQAAESVALLPVLDTRAAQVVVTAPHENQTLTTQPVRLTGTANDDVSVTRLTVAIKNMDTLQWLQPNATFATAFAEVDANDGFTPGATTTWAHVLPDNLPNGRYRAFPYGLDAAGRRGNGYVQFHLSNTAPAPDTRAPQVVVTAPNENQTLTTQPVRLTGTANDDVSVTRLTVAIKNMDTLQWLQPNATFATAFAEVDANDGFTPGATTTWAHVLPDNLPNGRYRAFPYGLDAAGRRGNGYVQFHLSNTAPAPDTRAPQVVVTAPNENQTLTTQPVRLTGTANDDVSVTRLTVAIKNMDTLQWLQPNATFATAFAEVDANDGFTPGATTTWAHVLPDGLPNGRYRAFPYGLDAAGRRGNGYVQFHVADPPPPAA